MRVDLFSDVMLPRSGSPVARIAEALPVYCRSDNPERRPRRYFTSAYKYIEIRGEYRKFIP